MKKYILFYFLLAISFQVQGQESMNVTLYDKWDNDSLPHNGSDQTFNEVWGYAADGREYAILGSAAFVHFFDVTNPSNIKLLTEFAGGDTTTWRDMKTYEDRAYSVSDFTHEGLMIYDLSDLPNSVTLVSQTTEFFSSSHNIYIDEANGRLYSVGTDSMSQGVVILDIATDPDNPIEIGKVQLPGGGYIHDIYVKDNIAYASHGNNGFYIWDFNDPTTPVLLASSVTNGYNHSSWLSEDGSFVLFAEEVPRGLPLGIMDISDIANNSIQPVNYFKQPLLQDTSETDNTPHNPYIKGNYGYVSYYEDGLQIWDLTDPLNPILAGYYDTFPFNNNYGGYWGCWGTYPYLPSNIILASDRKYGLHTLSFDLNPVSNEDLNQVVLDAHIYPNPSNGIFNIHIVDENTQPYSLEILDVSGKLLERFEFTQAREQVQLTTFSSGFYFGKITMDGKVKVEKLVIND